MLKKINIIELKRLYLFIFKNLSNKMYQNFR